MNHKERVKSLLSGNDKAIPLFKVAMLPSAADSLSEIIESGYIGQGPVVKEFEEGLETWIGKNVLAVNSCTSALKLALHLAGVKAGDKVITTPMTCIATNTPILECQAIPIFAGINEKTGNLSPYSVKVALSRNPDAKAIICAHWMGYPSDIEELSDIASIYNVPIIQDAASSFGATYQGKHLSYWSDYTCYSFQAIKHLTTGDGGALVCRKIEDYKRGKLLRWYGLDRESDSDFRCSQNVTESGYKYHMNDLTASIGLSSLGIVRSIVEKHVYNGKYYSKYLKDLKNIKLCKYETDRTSAFWTFPILLIDKNVDKFIEFMKKQGIICSRVHARNDYHDCFRKYLAGTLNGIDNFYAQQVSIPCGWWVGKEELEFITDTVRRFDNGDNI